MSVCRLATAKPLELNAPYDKDLVFEIVLDVAEPLQEDMVMRCCFCTEPDKKTEADHELEAIDVGNGPGLVRGIQKFQFEVPAPSKAKLEQSGVLEVAGLYLSASYRDQEFVRVGWYVRHEYDDPALNEEGNQPPTIIWPKLRRILSEPRVTRFPILWDQPPATSEVETPAPAASEQSAAEEPAEKRPRVEGKAEAPAAPVKPAGHAPESASPASGLKDAVEMGRAGGQG